MITADVPYAIDGKVFTGYFAAGDQSGKRPGILVCHEGGGLGEHAKERARMLAALGYAAFALDMFGEPVTSRAHAMEMLQGLMANLPTLRGRALAGLAILRGYEQVDALRTAAIGFCFGGTTVLELARSGADLACVVGFHSGLQTMAPQDARNVRCKVMVCLGAEDPIITPEHRSAFLAEMTAGGVDWQMLLYAKAGHSFTNREVDAMNVPGFAYDKLTDDRSWSAMRALFDETIGPV